MRGIGFFLGATLGAAILFFIISFVFFRPRTVKKDEINNFIQNSNSKIILQSIPFWSEYKGDDQRLGSIHFNKLTFLSNRNMSYIRAVSYTFYSDDLKKYVRTFTISEGGGMNSILLEFGEAEKDRNKYPDMIFYYNKTQNADPTFGTIDKPLPILHFRSSDPALRSMRSNNKDADPAYLKKVYEENVKLYLQYFIEKEDFKKLSPDSYNLLNSTILFRGFGTNSFKWSGAAKGLGWSMLAAGVDAGIDVYENSLYDDTITFFKDLSHPMQNLSLPR